MLNLNMTNCLKLPQFYLFQNQKRLKDFKGRVMSMSPVLTSFGNETEHFRMATILTYISQSQWKNTECTRRQASYKSSTKNYCQAEERRKHQKERDMNQKEKNKRFCAYRKLTAKKKPDLVKLRADN